MIITVIYLAGVVLATWPIYTFMGEESDRTGQVLMGTVAAFMALFWPAILGGWAAWRASRSIWSRILHDDTKENITP